MSEKAIKESNEKSEDTRFKVRRITCRVCGKRFTVIVSNKAKVKRSKCAVCGHVNQWKAPKAEDKPKRRPKLITEPHEIDRVVALRTQGRTYREIGDELGVSLYIVRSRLKEYGKDDLTGWRKESLSWDLNKAVELRDKGTSWREIGRELGVSHETVRDYFVRKGLLN